MPKRSWPRRGRWAWRTRSRGFASAIGVRRYLGAGRAKRTGDTSFLADTGKDDPAAELDATLRGAFGARSATADEVRDGAQPAFCRFPARIAWLKNALDFDPTRLAVEPCPKFEQYWERMAPESATLVFSSYYLNNPASAFGHTFLRIHKHQPMVSRDQRELLDYGVDYAAQADTSNPVLYAFKGLTGLFKGLFNLYPYFYKVREYNDYESRDLWEYDLDLTQSEVVMLAAHLYELGSTYFDYYYLDENCSYHVLGAIEAAAPRLHLLDHIKVPVVPADTVKALYANPGLVKDVRYRPSAMTIFNARASKLTTAQLDVLERLARDPETPLPAGLTPRQQIEVYDTTADLIDVRYAKDLAFSSDGPAGRIRRRILERRAAILEPSDELDIPPPYDKLPHVGHGSLRVWGGAGYSSADGPMYELAVRLTLHDLADPPRGYPELAQIEFLPTDVRFYPKADSLRGLQLESFDVVNVVSLHETSRFDHRLSWHIHAGTARVRDDGCAGCLVGDAVFGSGFTGAFGNDAVALYAMGDVSVEGSAALHGIHQVPALRAGLGPSGGLRVRLSGHALWLTTAHLYWLPDAVGTWTYGAETAFRWEYAPNVAVGVNARKFAVGEEAAVQTFLYF